MILLICAYTATRPGALVYVERNNKVLSKDAVEAHEEKKMLGDDDDEDDEDGAASNEEPLDPEEIMQCLCYKHIKLVLLPNPEGERDVLAVEIDLRFLKGHRWNAKR